MLPAASRFGYVPIVVERSAAPTGLVVAAGLIWLAPRRLLVQRRPREAAFGAGMLELPGGKVECGEAPRDALRRELCEEWGARASELVVGTLATLVDHAYPGGPQVLLSVFHVDGRAWLEAWRDRIEPEPGLEVVAIECASLPADEFLAADRPLMETVRAGDLRSPWA